MDGLRGSTAFALVRDDGRLPSRRFLPASWRILRAISDAICSTTRGTNVCCASATSSSNAAGESLHRSGAMVHVSYMCLEFGRHMTSFVVRRRVAVPPGAVAVVRRLRIVAVAVVHPRHQRRGPATTSTTPPRHSGGRGTWTLPRLVKQGRVRAAAQRCSSRSPDARGLRPRSQPAAAARAQAARQETPGQAAGCAVP